MKKKILIIFVSIFAMLVMAISFMLSIAANPVPKLLGNYNSEVELTEQLDSESFEQLTGEINELGDEFPYESLGYYASALYKKIHNISINTLTNVITAGKSANNLKCLLLDLCCDENKPVLLDYDKLVADLIDSTKDSNYRASILLYLNQDYTYGSKKELQDIYVSLVADEDDNIAATALQALYYSNVKKAAPVIDSILYDDTEKYGTKTVCRAIDLESVRIATSGNKEQIKKYTSQCIELIENKEYTSAVLYGLIDAKDIEAMKIVMDCEEADKVIKTYCVYNDYSVLEKWFTNSAITEENINFFLECMDNFHVKQALSILENLLESENPIVSENPEIYGRIAKTIEIIKKEGADYFEAWQ